MARRRTEASIIMLAGEHKINGFLSWQRIWSTQQMKCVQAPVDAIEPQVLGEPVVDLVLASVQTLYILHMGFGEQFQLIGRLVNLRHGATLMRKFKAGVRGARAAK